MCFLVEIFFLIELFFLIDFLHEAALSPGFTLRFAFRQSKAPNSKDPIIKFFLIADFHQNVLYIVPIFWSLP